MMIKVVRCLLVVLLPLCLCLSCSDDDDTAGGASLPVGTTFDVAGIYYVVTDSLSRTCGVTYGAGSVTSMLYSGVVDIPSTVRHDGSTYTVTSIEKQAFFSCKVTEVHLPTTVTTISRFAFEGCYLLTSLDIPSSVTYIGAAAFSGCSALTAMVVPAAITSIEYSTFVGCSALTEVVLGQAVASIGTEAFANCRSLSSLTVRNPSPPSCASDPFTNVFYNVPVDTCVLYVPKGSKEAYAEAEHWQDFMNIEETE